MEGSIPDSFDTAQDDSAAEVAVANERNKELQCDGPLGARG
jgi:hypothetical protein